jgi:hypothetical protein
MKNLNLQSIATLLILTLINLALLANGLEYRVKINSPNIDRSQISEFPPMRKSANFMEIGLFSDYLLAVKAQNNLEEKGISKTAVVAYFNHTQITLEDAFILSNNRNEQDIKSFDQPYMSEKEMEAALKRVQNEDFYYTVQIGIFNEANVNSFFDFPRTIDETITSKGYYRYTFGKFYTLNDVKDALKMMKENNFSNAEIIAFDNVERIPLVSAIEKEERKLQQSLAYFKD